MDDLIQRQAVLDALRARFGVDFDYGKWWSSSNVLAAIESVPPVTPQEPSEDATLKDIFCTGCEYKEQEPCEDAISRKAVDSLVDELARAISDERCHIPRGRSAAAIMQDILDLPSVTPKGVTVTDFADKCRECGREKVLDKIRTEIEQEYNRLRATRADETLELGECLGLKMSLKIIDRYRAESEGRNCYIVVPEHTALKEFKIGEKIPPEEWQKVRSVTEIIEEVRERLCNEYCKYPYEWDDETQGELSESEICAGCPLNRL